MYSNEKFPDDSFLSDFQISTITSERQWCCRKAFIHFSGEYSQYKLIVNMIGGMKEGDGLMIHDNGTLFMKLKFVKNECEGEVIKKNEKGYIILRGELEHGKECGLFEEHDDSRKVIWKGFYRQGKRYSHLKNKEGMNGFYSEMSEDGGLLSVSEYDDKWRKNGSCFEYEGGDLKKECVYENGVKKRTIREFTSNRIQGGYKYVMVLQMIEYKCGVRVYQGGCEGSIENGFYREGKGTEYENDGERAVYYGEWKNGKREGQGSEFKQLNPVYIGEWKNGLRDGIGEEYDENNELVRSGRWIEGEYGVLRYADNYGNNLSSFDGWLYEIERIEIGNDCFIELCQWILDGLNKLRSVRIGRSSFFLNKMIREGSKCVIMNCDQLREIIIGEKSFNWYESIELKNLPSLQSIQFDSYAFENCQSIVFESMND